MGLFNKSKLKVGKDIEGDTVHIFVNYYRLRKDEDFLISFIKDMAGGCPCLFVIDTSYIIKTNKTDIDANMLELTKALDSQSLRYDMIVTADDAGYSFMGFNIRRKDSQKKNKYIIGIAPGADEIDKIKDILDNYNIFCYMGLPDSDQEELIRSFNAVHGDMEELSKQYEYKMFNDCFICQFRVSAKEDNIKAAEEIIQRYS